MNARLETLKALGCDIDRALERFIGDEQLYLSCFDELIGDESIVLLGQALESGDNDKAFHYAHKLKGVLENMGMTEASKACAGIVEAIRSGSGGDGLLNNYDSFVEFMDKIRTV